MSDERLARIVEVMRMVQEDCEADAMTIDVTPVTGRALGERFGVLYAMVKVVAHAVEILAEERVTA